MKTMLVSLFVLLLVAAVGCTKSSSETSKTKATAAGDQQDKPKETVAMKPIAGEADKTFSLSVPFESVTLAQGEKKSMLIGINRGENFREDVTIKLSDLPQGVTMETASPTIKHGTTDATIMLKAAADASLGDFTFKVTGHTVSSGADFSKEIKLTVTKATVAGKVGETP